MLDVSIYFPTKTVEIFHDDDDDDDDEDDDADDAGGGVDGVDDVDDVDDVGDADDVNVNPKNVVELKIIRCLRLIKRRTWMYHILPGKNSKTK